MKEKIDRLARGIFRETKAEILASVQNVEITVETGRLASGSFVLSNSSMTQFKGIVFSSSSYLSFVKNTFSGTENKIEYTFDATGLDVRYEIKDNIAIVSECGELIIPFVARIIAPSCDSTIGSIRDSFHFANLARNSWDEAKKIFMTDNFRKVVAYYDKRHLALYDHLRESAHSDVALEEFLLAIKKKHSIRYKLERVKETGLKITKDTWGFGELSITTDCDFITIPRRNITTDDFEKDSYVLEFSIDDDRLHAGNNYGRIYVTSSNMKLSTEICCTKASEEKTSDRKKTVIKDSKKHFVELIDTYIKYRIGELSGSKFLSESNRLMKSLVLDDRQKNYFELYRIFTLIVGNRSGMAETLLDVVLEDDWWKNDDITAFGAVVFLEGMLRESTKGASEYVEKLRDLAAKDSDNLYLFIFLLMIDKRGKQNRQRRMDDMRRLYYSGSYSRLLYLEAYLMIKEDQSLLKEMGDFECAVMNFCLRYRLFDRGILAQMAYLSSHTKSPRKALVRLLVSTSAICHTNEILEALCTVLLKIDCILPQAAPRYRAAMVEQFDIPRLPEYVLKSSYGNMSERLPENVFMYFEMNRKLDDDMKKYLYANLVAFREENPAQYRAYEMDIRAFAEEQLRKHNCDDMLAVIYSDVYGDGEYDSDTAERLCHVIYKHQIVVDDDRITKVAVASRAFTDERTAEVTDHKAYIDICAEDDVILLLDDEGNKYCESVSYSAKRLIRNINLSDYVQKGSLMEERAVVHTYDCIANEGVDVIEPDVLLCISSNDNINHEYRMECDKRLVDYYYDNLEGDKLEEALKNIDLSSLSTTERIRIIELMIIRDMHDIAFEGICRFGFEGIDTKRILRMCAPILQSDAAEENRELMTKLCLYVFKHGKYNEGILRFLIDEFNGSIEDMYDIFKAAEGFEIDSLSIEERIVAQILFTESDMNFARTVFKKYYAHGANHLLIKAFLAYYGFGYLRDERMIDKELMQIMRRELSYDENDYSLLALLKGYSRQEEFSEQEKNFIEYSIMKLNRKGIVLSFFKAFIGKVRLPADVYDRQYVEYVTSPHSRVMIYSRFEDGKEEYKAEPMREVCPGVFIMDFVVFYGEGLQYYISEENDAGFEVAESSVIRLEPEFIGGDDTKYHMLNLIITAREMNDDKTAVRMLESYLKNDYQSLYLFKPL